MRHATFWHATPSTLGKWELGGKVPTKKCIRVDAFELNGDNRKYLDAILTFSSCSDLRLVGLSPTKREQRIREIMERDHGGRSSEGLTFLERCSRLQDLQGTVGMRTDT